MHIRRKVTLFTKRVLDILISASALFFFAPIFLIICAVIYFYDFSKIFYLQERVGRNCEKFMLIKFRTMIISADSIGGYQTKDNDPRITKVGRVLRKTSLDELPQLLNVLLGDMSLVGPRPDVPSQKTNYSDDEWIIRHSVRPGITGLAQATIRQMKNKNELRKKIDLSYVDELSLMLDFKIMFLTVRQIFTEGGN